MPQAFQPTIMTLKMSGERPLTLEQRVKDFIREHNLVASGQCLLVAVSGGPDSVCLLQVLLRLKDELGIRLHVAHLDHQLRGAESEADANYVAHLTERLGVPVTIDRRDVRAYKARRRISLEEAAREVRYRFLADTAAAIGANRLAVGHTLDDHVETILMHLVRGSGTRGLRGLKPATRWRLPRGKSLAIIRPLLALSRRETAGYCQKHGLEPRIDASNLSLSSFRNRIRLQLLPLLKAYNPQVTEALLRTAEIAADDLAFIDQEAARLWPGVAQRQGDTIILDREALGKIHPALKRNLLRRAIEGLLGSLKDIEACHIEGIMAALNKPAGKQVSLPGGLIFAIEYDRYLLGPGPAAMSPYPVLEAEHTLEIPGETHLPGWLVTATIINREEMIEEDGFTAYLDLDKTGSKLVVRSRRYGDRFQPLGLGQSKKLAEFMIDARIPRAWRQNVPIVCSPEHIVWLVGWRIDERVKVTEETKKILRLEFKRG